MQANRFKTTHRLIRAIIARFLCLLHISLSIFVLYSLKKDLLYLLPIIGAVLLIAETAIVIILFDGREPTAWFSSTFFIYVTTIVGCYWFLELENISKILSGKLVRDYFIRRDDLLGDLVSNIKIIWSQVELQIFFAFLMIIRWLIPKSNITPHGLSELLFKYFAISCDMLDFLSILQDVKLIQIKQLVFWTLSVWSWSTIQYFIYVPKFEDEEKREFHAYITNSLLSVLFLDLPYFGVRIAAIFAFGSHNYNSYFFATKNLTMILLQMIRIKATFSERKIRQDKAAKRLKDMRGFDKEPNRIFESNELAKRYLLAQRLKNAEQIMRRQEKTELTQQTSSGDSLDELGVHNGNRNIRVPRMIETVKQSKSRNNNHARERSLDNLENLDQEINQTQLNQKDTSQNYESISSSIERELDHEHDKTAQAAKPVFPPMIKKSQLYTPKVQYSHKHTDV
jgi:hypothetical protein